jgi:endonuclease/exonuclease/phosphatase family metal-dependent hydrolase
MKTVLLTILLSCAGFIGSRADDTLSIASYNVKVFSNNPAFPNGNYGVIAGVLQSLHPDVVCLQELDSVTTRTQQVYQLQQLSFITGWHYCYASAIPYRGGSYGLGITSRHPIRSSTSFRLTSGAEQRILLVVEFERWVVACTHLDLNAAISRKQAQEITAYMQSLYAGSFKPVFLAGDFNAAPDSDTMKEFRKHWTPLSGNAHTFPAGAPDVCIDYILMLDKRTAIGQTLRAEVIGSSPFGNLPVESDHLPIMVTVAIPSGCP